MVRIQVKRQERLVWLENVGPEKPSFVVGSWSLAKLAND
jgi:hypothetical protein